MLCVVPRISGAAGGANMVSGRQVQKRWCSGALLGQRASCSDRYHRTPARAQSTEPVPHETQLGKPSRVARYRRVADTSPPAETFRHRGIQ